MSLLQLLIQHIIILIICWGLFFIPASFLYVYRNFKDKSYKWEFDKVSMFLTFIYISVSIIFTYTNIKQYPILHYHLIDIVISMIVLGIMINDLNTQSKKSFISSLDLFIRIYHAIINKKIPESSGEIINNSDEKNKTKQNENISNR